MVTQSRFEPVMSSSALEAGAGLPPHRYKTFCSRLQHQLVLSATRKLQESGFYWGTISGREADGLLGDEPAGTFLVRDSSDSHHFFTISVKTTYGTKNLRVQCDSCSFFLPTDPESAQATAPRFDCVLKLVHHYMPPAAGRAPPCGSAENGASSRSTYFIYSGGEKIPLELLRPLCATMSSLQHLCRKTVNGHLDVCSKRDQLPHTLKEFLQEYDAPI